MRVIALSLIPVLVVSLAFDASAQQSAGSGSAADGKYCSTLAKLYQSMYPVQEGMSASDVTLLSGCETNAPATIVALRRKLADKKIALPPEPGVAHGNPSQ
jgi:hypothetical protein